MTLKNVFEYINSVAKKTPLIRSGFYFALKPYWRVRNLVLGRYGVLRNLARYIKNILRLIFYTYLYRYKFFKLLASSIRRCKTVLSKLQIIVAHGIAAKNYSMSKRSEFILKNNIPCFVIKHSFELEIDGPKFIGVYDFSPIGEKTVILAQAQLDISTYTDAFVMGGTNFTRIDNTIIHPDQYIAARDVCPAELNGIARINLKNNSVSLYAGDAKVYINAISLLGCCTGNYAHWLTETLPKLLLLDSIEAFNDYPLLVDSWIHPNFIASINLVKKHNRELVFVPRWKTLKIQNLIDISPPAYVPPEYRAFHEEQQLETPRSADFPFSRYALNMLRNRAHEALEIEPPQVGCKIYLHRSRESCGNTRYVKNVADIEKLVSSYGYRFLDPAKLSFDEQVKVFSQASHVISPLGAALSNLIFTYPSCRVLGLSPYYDNANYYYFSNFMGVLGHELSYVLGKQVTETGHPFHRDYEINIAALKAALDIMSRD